jgi:serine/threonine-protein kinase
MASDVFGIVGTTVAGAFHVQEVVAEGGFAVVYRAQHAVFRAPVALKCLKIPEHLTDEEQERFERQFQAEAEVLFKLSAGISAVVRPLHVAAVLTSRGRFMPFLALEWLDGETLDAAATRRAEAGQAPFTIDELVELLTPVARALQSAHHFIGPDGPQSIVHRDVKPENVFIARTMNGRVVKILDFGIAKVKGLAKQVTTGRIAANAEKRSSFSPAFGAPEQWAPQRFGPTGPWTDVWGLALTMVEVLAAHPILDGDDSAMMGTALDPTRRPTPWNEGVAVSAAVDQVFERALSVNPQARYRHAGEFWDALLAARAADARRPFSSSAPSPRRQQVRTGGHAVLSSGGAAPVLQQSLPGETPFSASIELDLDDDPLVSRRQGNFEPESGEWASEQHRADAVLPWGGHPERASGRNSSAPPAQGRPDRPPLGFADRRSPASSRPPGAYGEAELPTVPPVSSSVRVWSGGTHRPVVKIDPGAGLARTLSRLMLVPLLLLGAGVVLTIVNGAYAGENGEVLMIGPVRLAWVAATAVLTGLGLATYRLWARMA